MGSRKNTFAFSRAAIFVEIKARSSEHSTDATFKERNENIPEQEQMKNVKLFLREPYVKDLTIRMNIFETKWLNSNQ